MKAKLEFVAAPYVKIRSLWSRLRSNGWNPKEAL